MATPLFREIDGKFEHWKGERLSGVSHPINIGDVWSEDELEAIGLFKLYDDLAPTLEAGDDITLVELEKIDGKLQKKYTVGKIPKDDNLRKTLQCTKLQAVMILNEYDMLNQVESIVGKSDETVQLAWKYCTTLERDSIMVNLLYTQLIWPDSTTITEEELDEMFIAAAELKF